MNFSFVTYKMGIIPDKLNYVILKVEQGNMRLGAQETAANVISYLDCSIFLFPT